ncbi:HNH endonuclease signature motif containing protein [Vibrio agarivorans]|uniref:HNH endonuclease signature motif containing protein n=1 Tax=Vibrio agarivorans TaxID=153622 RepID=UPI0025B28E4D|nr:HNH endonuclease [Vibrio agarivorans]MDN3661071.1 HNH endonuclease [Vibrio agarivorans]
MLNYDHLKQLGIDPAFFMEVTRNVNATARMDNPHVEEDDKVYQEARGEFINELRESFDGDNALRCEKCGLVIPSGYHIHHKDGDHTNNDKSNFSLRDPFCHLSSHLGFVGVNNMASVVYVPQIPQAVLNQIQIISYAFDHVVSTVNQSSKKFTLLKRQKADLDTLMSAVKATKGVVYRNFQTNDPLHFANIFAMMTEDEYLARAFKTDSANQLAEIGTFAGLRLLFEPSKFETEIKSFARYILIQDNETNQHNPAAWFDAAKLLKQKRHG